MTQDTVSKVKMALPQSVTFKAHLETGNPVGDPQLGWFSVHGPLISSITHLTTKVRFIFSLPKTQTLRIFHQDPTGKRTVILKDEELLTVVSKPDNGLCRVYVTLSEPLVQPTS